MTRAVVVVTEGAAPELLDRWADALPAFRALLDRGASGPLVAEQVPYEPPGLTSAFTGYAAADHGWLSYWSVHERDYRPRVLTPDARHTPFLWERPELADRTFGVVNVFGTHPPRPINGSLVTYPTMQTTRACYPPDLAFTLSRKGIRLANDVSIWFSGQPKHAFVEPVLAADEARGAAALDLLDGTDVLVVNLTSIDRLSHVYWQEIEPGSPVALEDAAVFRAYRTVDAILGRLLDRVDERTELLAFSEIGFGPLRAYCSVNDVLAAAGLLELDGGGALDHGRTRAFESVQGTHGVNVNVRGRYDSGSVAPDDYDAVRTEVREVLRDHVNPLTGLPMFVDVLPREKVYDGEATAAAPDLILVPADDRYLPFGDPYWSSHVHRSLQSGWHRRSSYWAGAGGGFRSGRSSRPAEPKDVAPTILDMLGLPAFPDLAGTPLGRHG